MKKSMLMMLVLISSMFMATSAFAATNMNVNVTVNNSLPIEQTGKTGRVNWSQGSQSSIEAVGIGVPPNTIQNRTQGKALARRAAIVDAYRNLAETIQGVRVDSETTVQNLMVANDVVNTKVSAVVRNAQIIRESAQDDGSYQVVMSVNLYGVGSIGEVAIEARRPEKIHEFPQVSMVSKKPIIVETYTGLIIDARGLELEPSFSPRVYDISGRIVYGNMYIDADKAKSQGMVEYSVTAEMVENAIKGGSRAGSKPLIIKAVAIKESGNVVISTDDADKLLESNETVGFLRNCAVVFVQ